MIIVEECEVSLDIILKVRSKQAVYCT